MIRILLFAALLVPGSALAQPIAPLAPVEEVLSFPIIDPSETAFPQVNALEVGVDGTLYLGLFHLRSVRMFKPDGSFIGAFGSPGSGDGQMGGIGGLRWNGDTLVVLDRTFGRLVHFDSDGTPLGAEEATFERRFEFESPPTESFIIERDEGRLGWRSPYRFAPLATESADRSRAALVEMEGDHFRLTVADPGGDVVHELPWTPIPVDRAQVVEAIVSGFATTFEVEPETLYDEIDAEVVLPDFAPPVLGIALGAGESIWLRMWRTPGMPAWWTEFVDGIPVRTVELPPQADLLKVAGDRFFLTVRYDETLHLVEYRIGG